MTLNWKNPPTPRYNPQPGEARKALRRGHPELGIACSKCGAAVGFRCRTEPRQYFVTHFERQNEWARLKGYDPDGGGIV